MTPSREPKNPNNGTQEPKRTPGRPAKITLEVVEEIGEKIGLGMTMEQVCLVMDPPVNIGSLRSALQRSPKFAQAMEKAKAAFVLDALRDIREGKRCWTGAAWILERRHKAQFQRTEHVQVQEVPGAMSPALEETLGDAFARSLSRMASGAQAHN